LTLRRHSGESSRRIHGDFWYAVIAVEGRAYTGPD